MCTICYHVPCTRRSYSEVRGIIVFVTFRNSFVCVYTHFNAMDFSYVSTSLNSIAHCRAYSLLQLVLLLGREDQPRKNYKCNSNCSRLRLFQFIHQAL